MLCGEEAEADCRVTEVKLRGEKSVRFTEGTNGDIPGFADDGSSENHCSCHSDGDNGNSSSCLNVDWLHVPRTITVTCKSLKHRCIVSFRRT